MKDEIYLGDGVYGSHDNCHVWLTTERDGHKHMVAIDPGVMRNMLDWLRELERDFNCPGYWTGDTLRKRRARSTDGVSRTE